MIRFYKYQGTGNDFIMIDNRSEGFPKNDLDLIQRMCDRRFGIGADGLILIEGHNELDFRIQYHNSDGSRSFCGNGARCAVRFAAQLGMVKNNCSFEAIDGTHKALLDPKYISLHMLDVENVVQKETGIYQTDTGSPHYVSFVNKLDDVDIVQFGKEIRYSEEYEKEGINVNIAQRLDSKKLKIKTYERGVEDETFSCGTGATAVALAFAEKENLSSEEIKVEVKGGDLFVAFQKSSRGYGNIWLKGPAKFVFEGVYE